MDSHIIVRCNEEEAKVGCNNGLVNKITLRNAFLLADDTAISLVKDDLVLPCDENNYFHLGSNWKAEIFDLKWKQQQINQERVISKNKRKSSDETTAAGEDMDSLIPHKRTKLMEDNTVKDLGWLDSIKQFALYYKDRKGVKKSITPITKTIAATYAHSSHQNLKVGDELKIKCYYNENYSVVARVVKRDNDLDVVILQACETEFTSTDIDVDNPQLGIRYMMLGFSNLENPKYPINIKTGNIACIWNDDGQYVGSSGSEPGDSGAGLWSSNRKLLGMNVSVIKNEVFQGSSRQYTHAIGGRSIFLAASIIRLLATKYIKKPDPIINEDY